MAVLVEAISVIVRRSAIEASFPGGWDGFVDDAPNSTLCADEFLARVGFMSPVDVQSFVKQLERHGVIYLKDGMPQAIVIADQQRGLAVDCEWAECGTVTIDGNNIKSCRFEGDSSDQLITPDGWKFEGSLSQTFGFVPTEQIDKSLKFLRHENGLDIYMNALTGEEVVLGRSCKN